MKTKVIEVTKADIIAPYTLSIKFSDGYINKVCFEKFLKKSTNPQIKKYLNKKLFANYTIENGELHWNNYELSFHPEDYYFAKEI